MKARDADLAKSRDRARGELAAQTKALAAEMARKVLGREVRA